VFMKSARVVLTLLVVLAMVPSVFAERLTGSLRGRITDKAGFPLPGAFIYVSSDALQGSRNYITADTGDYGFLHLPPGTYRITVEMPGFKTVNVDKLRVDTGKGLTLNFRLEATEIEEEVTRLDSVPALDSRSPGISFTVDADLLRHAPLTRDFASVVRLAPGIIPDDADPDRFFSVHGSTVRANTFALNGLIMSDPLTMAPSPGINTDIIDQVEFETMSHPVETFSSEGAYVNIVTKSGGNSFLGELRILHTSDALTNERWTEKEIAEKGVAAPLDPQKRWDFGVNLGGPIMEDRVWYFASFRLDFRSRTAPFKLWTDPLGTVHDPYNWRGSELMSFLKLSTQVSNEITAALSFGYSNRYQPVSDTYLTLNSPKSATRGLRHDGQFTASANVTYKLNQDTFFDLVGSLIQRSTPLLLDTEGSALPSYVDAATGYTWGSAAFNEKSTGRRFRGAASITHFKNSLGISHELRAGADYEETYGDQSTWKNDNLIMNWLDKSPYYFGTAVSPTSGKTVGKGLIGFYLAAQAEDGLLLKNDIKRVGFYAQDALTIARRATFSLGLRFDRSVGRIQTLTRGASGNAVSIDIGKKLIKTVYGFNPYDAGSVPGWDSMLVWNALSPRAGLSLDLFGNGRTILKTSFGRYAEYLNLGYFKELAMLQPSRYHQFYWYDENGDSAVSTADSFALFSDDYRTYTADIEVRRVAPGVKAPMTSELTLGLLQEISKDFSVSLTYISKIQKNIVESVLYDPNSGVEWYEADGAAAKWWIPFSTVVPAAHGYAETPLTVYFRSSDAPAVFERIQNVPQLKRTYKAVEITARKRMSDNWQFYGSITWGRAEGNIGLGAASSTGYSPAAGSPNYFVNLVDESRLDLDRPAAVRLLGTYRFPKDFYLTLYYSGRSGYPWARSVTVVPPDSWAEANGAVATPVTVYLEKPGERRAKFDGSLDMRVEKEFVFRNRKKLTLTIDVLNLMGHRSSLIDLNDGGYWYPAAADSSDGQRVVSPTFEKYLSLLGERRFLLSLNVQF
jgi:hypothetical protein